MAKKKMDRKSVALSAAKSSGTVFEALKDEPVKAPRKPAAPAKAAVKAAPVKPAAPTPKAAPAAKPQKTEIPKMDTQTFAPTLDLEATADRVRGLMDGKGMMERTQRLAQEASELAKGNLEAMMASSKIAAQNAGTLGQDVAELGRKSFEGASEAMKSFAEAKSPTELLRLQSEFAKSYMETMFAEGARLSETMVKLTGEALQPVQSRVAANVEKAKSIAN